MRTEIEKVWITDDAVWVRRSDATEACEPFADYARLRKATPEQRAAFDYDDFGIHWPALDEDLSFESFFRAGKEKTRLYRLFLEFPEINVSALARRLGISQSLMAQYIGGSKRISPEREAMIIEELRALGRRLASIG